MPRLGTAVAVGILVLTGCGQQDGQRVAGDVPITSAAIAAITLDHASDDTTSRRATYTDEGDPKGALGADLRYRGGNGDDGDLLRVMLLPGRVDDPCDEGYDGHCEREQVDGGTLSLYWEEEVPEEDPGLVGVVLRRDGETVWVHWSGGPITGDPRDADLAVPVTTMREIATDPRLALHTSQEAVEAGKDLDGWERG